MFINSTGTITVVLVTMRPPSNELRRTNTRSNKVRSYKRLTSNIFRAHQRLHHSSTIFLFSHTKYFTLCKYAQYAQNALHSIPAAKYAQSKHTRKIGIRIYQCRPPYPPTPAEGSCYPPVTAPCLSPPLEVFGGVPRPPAHGRHSKM